MNLTNARSGLNLTEAVIVCLITGILTLSATSMMSSSFESEVGYNMNVRARQHKNIISERISSKVKEASKAYYSSLSLSIPYDGVTYNLSPETDSLAVLVPMFDAAGDLVQPSTNTTSFIGVAFSIITDPSKDDGTFILIETHMQFDLTVSSSDPLAISVNLPSDWSAGESYVVSDNLVPATFANLGSNAFDVEGDYVNFAFVPQDGNIYFPSPSGTLNINDGEYITRCQFRNFRI